MAKHQMMNKIKKSIFDFFSYDLSKMNLEDFLHYNTSYSPTGHKIESYYKKLNPEELGVFCEVKLMVLHNGQKNISYFGRLDLINENLLKRFIIELIDIYKKDFTKSYKLTPQEWKSISSGEFWSGRTWLNIPNLRISIDSNMSEEDYFVLSILGVR